MRMVMARGRRGHRGAPPPPRPRRGALPRAHSGPGASSHRRIPTCLTRTRRSRRTRRRSAPPGGTTCPCSSSGCLPSAPSCTAAQRTGATPSSSPSSSFTCTSSSKVSPLCPPSLPRAPRSVECSRQAVPRSAVGALLRLVRAPSPPRQPRAPFDRLRARRPRSRRPARRVGPRPAAQRALRARVDLFVPVVGASLLHYARGLLSDPDRFINQFLIGLFAIASSVKPFLHFVKLVKRRVSSLLRVRLRGM